MYQLLPLLEIAAFATVVCVFHRLKPVLSTAPFYALIGLFEAFIFVADKAAPGAEPITVQFFGSGPAFLGYTLFLPLLLAALIVVYALEGTGQARRVLIALVALHVVHAGIDVVIAFHAAHPPPGQPDLSATAIAEYSLPTRLFSLVAFLTDAVVIIVAYQFLVNRLPRVPLAALLFVALVLAMCSDAVVFGVLYGLPFSLEGLQLVEKAQSAVAVALPMSVYLNRQFARERHAIVDGVVERHALELVDLRKEVRETRRRLVEERKQHTHVRELLGRYVSPEVREQILADPSRLGLGGETRHVTVLFADIAGYTRMSEALSPPEVLTLLNQYFHRVTEVILAQRGMINEYIGDAVLAVFGAPLELPDHATRALRAAEGMLAAVERLNAEWHADGTVAQLHRVGFARLDIRIGVHSGHVVAGNIGSATRMKYGIIGDTVNSAARVEQLNKVLGTSLLFTRDTVQRLGDEAAELALIDLGKHTVRGRIEPLHVYTLRGAPVPQALSDVLPTVGA